MDFLALFHKGGLVMYPLLLCSVIAIAILVERIRTYRAARSKMDTLRAEVPALVEAGDVKGLRELCEADGGAPAEMIASALTRTTTAAKEAAMQGAASTIAGRLRAHLNYLETIVTLAPLLGLLGTVTGMISSFSVLAVSDGQPFAITGGVGEALVATATGLCVAIIALVIHTYLVQQQDRLITDMEEASAVYMNSLLNEAIDAVPDRDSKVTIGEIKRGGGHSHRHGEVEVAHRDVEASGTVGR